MITLSKTTVKPVLAMTPKVVYFDQQKGAVQAVNWSKYWCNAFFAFFTYFEAKKGETRSISKKTQTFIFPITS